MVSHLRGVLHGFQDLHQGGRRCQGTCCQLLRAETQTSSQQERQRAQSRARVRNLPLLLTELGTGATLTVKALKQILSSYILGITHRRFATSKAHMLKKKKKRIKVVLYPNLLPLISIAPFNNLPQPLLEISLVLPQRLFTSFDLTRDPGGQTPSVITYQL